MAKDPEAGDGVTKETMPVNEVTRNVSAKEELAAATKIVERLGTPADRGARGKGRFGAKDKAEVEQAMADARESDEGSEEAGSSEPESAPSRRVERVEGERRVTKQGAKSLRPEDFLGEEDETPFSGDRNPLRTPTDDELVRMAEAAGVEMPVLEPLEGEEEEEPLEEEGPEEPVTLSDAELVTDSEIQQLLDQANAAVHPAKRRAEQASGRSIESERQRADRAEQLANVLLDYYQNGGQPPTVAATPAAPAEPEEDPDPILEPEKYKAKLAREIRAEIQPEIDAIRNEGRIEKFQQQAIAAEGRYAQANPGYKERVAAYRGALREELIGRYTAIGADNPEQIADHLMAQNDAGHAQMATAWGLDPFAYYDDQATRYLRGRGFQVPNGQPPVAAAPAKPAATAKPAARPTPRQAGSVAAARAALRSPSAGSLGDAGSEGVSEEKLSARSILRRGVSSDEIRETLRTGGINALMELVRPVEAAITRERGM